MKKLLIAIICLITTVACRAQEPVIAIDDIMDVFNFKSTIALGDNEEKEAAELTNMAVNMFTAKGFAHGLTGDGYGGPCVIIDGFYKGGVPNKEQYCFAPGDDKDNACVIEMSACNDGDQGDYELFVTVELFTKHAATAFIKQFGQSGFNMVGVPDDDGHCTFTDGTHYIDYSHETGYANDSYFFIIQTAARKQRIN